MSGIVNSTGARSGVIGTTVGTPTAAILQLLSTTTTAPSSVFNTADSWSDIPGMTIAITPASSSNKILLSFSINVGGITQKPVGVKMLRGATDIGVGDSAGSLHYRTWTSERIIGDESYEQRTLSGQFLDSGGGTFSAGVAVTFKLQWIVSEGGGAVFLNRPYSFADNADRTTSASTITVMEVSG